MATQHIYLYGPIPIFSRKIGNRFTRRKVSVQNKAMTTKPSPTKPNKLPPALMLSADLELDPYHPSNQPYVKTEQAIKRVVVDQSVRMNPRHVKIAKMHLRGNTRQEMIDETGLVSGTVSQILSRPDVIELLRTLIHLDQHHEGINLRIRKSMLNEIAIDNKIDDPRLTVTAIQELNRIDGTYELEANKPQVIIINNGTFPRGALD